MPSLPILPAAIAVFIAFTPFQQPKQPQPVKPLTLSSYEQTKLHITALRQTLKQAHVTDTTLLQQKFVSVVADSLIPHWYGTPWDFNGTTQVPGKGAIACGYFVTTVLRDAGVNLNRVKMGQASSEELTYLLAAKKDIKVFYDKPLPALIQYIRAKGFGLYIIGLDSHVGFILNDNKNVWFIHSKWFGEKCVVKEDASTSAVLYYSKYRMVGKISNSKKVLGEWL